jgi:hypothetical protein
MNRPNYVIYLLLFMLFGISIINAAPISNTKKVNKASGHHCTFPDASTVPFIGLNDSIQFYANESCLLFRTDNFILEDKDALEYSYFIEGKRTRLFAYVCLMESGGECVLTKHRSEDGGKEESCGILESYMFKPSNYSFFFQFERRPRKFSDKEKEARWRRRRHGRASHRLVAEVTLNSIEKRYKLCKETP